MEDKENKRLKRLLAVSWVFITILIILIATLGSYQIAQLKQAVEEIKIASVPGPKGDKGDKGDSGLVKTESIVSYLPGEPAKAPTDEQVHKAVYDYLSEHPVSNGKDGDQGQKGDPGTPGLAIFVRQNAIGLWECRFAGDIGWSPIEECGNGQ